MKRAFAAAVIVLLFAGGALAYRIAGPCGEWQERYKRFVYAEMLKNSPEIHTPETIEEIVGGRPPLCDRPSLGEDDIERYRREGVGPNEFSDELRAHDEG